MKLGIQPLLPAGNYLNKRYSIEMDFPDDSHIADNYKFLNEAVISVHMAEFPFFYKDGKPLYLPQNAVYVGDELMEERKVDKKTAGFEHFAKEIRNCPTIPELETYRVLANNTPGMIEIFNEQMIKLKP